MLFDKGMYIFAGYKLLKKTMLGFNQMKQI